MENVEILDVFPIFHTARLGQKIRRSPQLPLCGVALYFYTFSKGNRVAFASVVNDPFVRIFESNIDPLIHLDIEAVSAM